MPGVLATGAVLVLLGGSQGFALDQFPAAGSNLRQPGTGEAPAARGDQSASATALPAGNSIDGGSTVLGGAAAPPAGNPVQSGAASSGSSPTSSPTSSSSSAGSTPPVVGGTRVPGTVYTAYLNAEQRLASTQPGCHLPWQLLAGIGQVESGQADGGNVTADGTVRTPILGPPLNGQGFAAIRAADGSWARAEGPMQFIPSTWAVWGVDGNSDGKADPENVFDATLSAADYLCSGGRDLSNSADLNQAILGYNGSQAYLAAVLAWMAYFQHTGALPAPDAAGPAGGSIPSADNSASPNKNGNKNGKGKISPTNDPTKTPSPSAQPTSKSPRPTASPTRTAHPSPTPKPTTASPTPSATPTSPQSSKSPSATPSRSGSPSPSVSPSNSASPSPSGSPSPSPTCSAPSPTGQPSSSTSPTATASPAPSDSPTPSGAPTPTATPTSDCH